MGEHFNGDFVLVGGKTGQRGRKKRVEGQCRRPDEPCAMYNRTLYGESPYREKVCAGKAKEEGKKPKKGKKKKAKKKKKVKKKKATNPKKAKNTKVKKERRNAAKG